MLYDSLQLTLFNFSLRNLLTWAERLADHRRDTLHIQISKSRKKKRVCSLLTNLRARLVNKSVVHSIVNKTLSDRKTSKYRKLLTIRAIGHVYSTWPKRGEPSLIFWIAYGIKIIIYLSKYTSFRSLLLIF